MDGGSDRRGAKLFALRFAILVFVIGGCGRSDASRPALPTSRASPAAEEMFTYTLPPEGKPLGDVIHDAEVATGFTLLFDGIPLRNRRAVMAGTASVPKAHTFDVFQEILLACEYVATPLGDAEHRIWEVDALDSSRWIRLSAHNPFIWSGNIESIDPTGVPTAVTVFLIREVRVEKLRAAVQAVCEAAADQIFWFRDIESANAIVARGPVPSLRKIQHVIAALDVSVANTRPGSAK